MNALNIIRKPVITEKSSQLEVENVYAFWVNPKATKIDIKKAITSLFGVEVEEVRTLKVGPKTRKLRKGVYNKRKNSHKAYVTLKGKAKLDTTKFEKAEKESKLKVTTSKTTKKVVKKTSSKKTK
jgi:large subunit ribosomal protein L23